MIRRIVLVLLALVVLQVLQVPTLGGGQVSRAQGQELLNNPSFESYYGANGALVPTGWTLTSSTYVGSSGHKWPGESLNGASWDVNATKTVFTMVAYQMVPGVRSGSKLRFSAWANVFTCDRTTSCIENGKSFRVSDQGSQGKTRIGVDPNGGTDPNSPSVVWSAYIAPFDQFQQMIMDFSSQNDNGVTVFLNFTESAGMLLNHVYWDDASLQLLQPGQGGTTGGGSTASGGSGSNPQFAPPVKAQGAQPDGSIIHVVQPGDTLSSIAYAYKITVAQLRKLNKLSEDDWVLQIGQKLIVKPPDQATAAATRAATGAATGVATGDANTVAGTESFGAIITTTPTVSVPVSLTFPAETAAATLPATVPATGAATAIATGAATSGATSVADVPTVVATTAATAEATSVATTAATNTSTPAPTLVAIQTTPLPTVVPISKEGSICVTAFEDANTNHWMDANEKLLPGVALNLSQSGSTDKTVKTLTTAADSPTCFSGIDPGTYGIAAVPPTSYGLTTSGQLEVEVKPGVPLALTFGAANGYKSTPASSDVVVKDVPPPTGAQDSKTVQILDKVISNSGLIVFGLAGLVLVAGLGMALVIRRR